MNFKYINKLFFILIFWISIFSFLYFFSDKNGWEGNDLAQLEGIINFQYKGKTGVYNYYWQPLSYQLGILLFSLFKSEKILFLTPQIFGATSIVILTLSVYIYIYSSTKLNPVLCFSFLIIFPELWFSSLYYNSTVIGMRNKLVHDYDGINLPLIWSVVKNEIPELIDILELIVPFSE
jgi:hypothetical protein